jgi:hypothetical protein
MKGSAKRQTEVQASEDVLIQPYSVRNVAVSAALEGRDDWIVEKVIIGTDEQNIMAAPTTWITSSCPYVPIANTGPHPRYVRTGEVVGHLMDPDAFLDKPKDEDYYNKMIASAEAFKKTVVGTLKAQDLATAENPAADTPGHDDRLEDDSSWGPKTTAVPEDPLEGDVDKLVNLGPDIPIEYQDRLTEVLRRNAAAFGVNGRLGRIEARVGIPLLPDTQPISEPMYGASPAKREVIDKQMKTWFEADVIEPSVSPWGFPVVISYRNGKPRLVIDYRKLNAKTIPDEFPIPRQSEIIQALSGAQVLSSFDALAGFTQLEMADDAKEKTAFRCHLGLWQFKRMPFGLRNGPSIFQRIMQGVLAPFLWLFTLVYIDDIVIYSKSWEDHLEHLDRVLSAIAASGITLSPAKCFVGFSSILLLGQKVSRLGLSTHKEKVQAIMDLARPTSVSDLQKFLGMVVYFSTYIPFYSMIAAPLFDLLRKGVKWQWRAEQETAYQQAKEALANAPVLGHPIAHQPYRLYTDASDLALGASLQQVQPILAKDLKGTPCYSKLEAAWIAGKELPQLIVKLHKEKHELKQPDVWGATLDETTVHVERVIAYWSRTFKSAERNYSATEREALAAKEALVKFQPFIEGEEITLVTDHAALVWARVYENANRRLAAWGAVFAAYPGLTIVHRAGRIHSNVDPLSRLIRIPPHDSPFSDDYTSIEQDEAKRNIAQKAEDRIFRAAAPKAAFIAFWWEDVIDKRASAVRTRQQLAADSKREPSESTNKRIDNETQDASDEQGDILPFPNSDHWTYPSGTKSSEVPPDEEWTKKTQLLVSVDPIICKEFAEGYEEDKFFAPRYVKVQPNEKTVISASHFQRGRDDLLYFVDAGWKTRLCVPSSKVNYVLRWIHESPYESAHAGPRRFIARLQELFFWPSMNKDAETYASTCDVCQKIKVDHRAKMGALRPAHIPPRPFATVSMDMITGLPPSGEQEYTAILVIVDKLTKFAIIIPTHSTLTQEGFAKIFVEKVVNVYGLPEVIISDRDKRWATIFWKSVVSNYGSVMALSSAHHPQTDGQTEILNATIEQMLRAYVSSDKESWSSWLSVLAYSYNSSVHSSTKYSPNFLLMGYNPRTSVSAIIPEIDPALRPFLPSQSAEDFVEALETHRNSAKDAIALAQDRQAKAYDKKRRPVQELEVGDYALVNPHTLELVDVAGTGKKLIQRMIGPFEVVERINPMVYRLRLPDTYSMHPVFNLEHLRKYVPSPTKFGERTELPPTRELRASEEYEVEAILGHRLTGKKKANRRMFLVRWKNYGPADDSWVTEYDLRNSAQLKRDYLKSKNLAI